MNAKDSIADTSANGRVSRIAVELNRPFPGVSLVAPMGKHHKLRFPLAADIPGTASTGFNPTHPLSNIK
jgi:hypothetical protein